MRLTSTAAHKTAKDAVFMGSAKITNRQKSTTGFPHFVSLEAASSCCMAGESFP